jgi:hypothetical protein
MSAMITSTQLLQRPCLQNAKPPIHRLPPELIGSIFEYASSSAPWTQSREVLFVCRQWHDIAWSLQSLWCHIDLGKPSLALKHLERCQSSQLLFVRLFWTEEMYIDDSGLKDFERAFMSVMAESERIHTFVIRSPSPGKGYTFEELYQDRLSSLLRDHPPCFSSLYTLDIDLNCCPLYLEDHKCNYFPDVQFNDPGMCLDGLFAGNATRVSELHLQLCSFNTLELVRHRLTILDLSYMPLQCEQLLSCMHDLAPSLEILCIPINTPLGWTSPESQKVIRCPRMRRIRLRGTIVALIQFLSALVFPIDAKIRVDSVEDSGFDHARALSALARYLEWYICNSACSACTYRVSLSEAYEGISHIRFSQTQSSGFFRIYVAPGIITFEDLSIEMHHAARARVKSLRIFGTSHNGPGMNFDLPSTWYTVAQAYQHISHLFVSGWVVPGLVHTLATEIGRPFFPHLSALDMQTYLESEYDEEDLEFEVAPDFLPMALFAAHATRPKLHTLGLFESPRGTKPEEIFREIEDALKSHHRPYVWRMHTLVVKIKPMSCMI